MEKELELLGKRIAELRAKRNLTQDKLAELTNYSTNHIAKLESARTNPSFELIVKIAKALNVEINELFYYEEYQKTEHIKKELEKILKNTEENKINLLYKIFKAID